ncbi:MAG: hypothetical protein JWO72_757 [Caulobacteraceae bacterium]|jgi:hypothetical protein|nr:hypothetical protein [Caulobacteraceae bacterium]
MTTERFWVIGGDYTDTEFRSLRSAQPTVAGPFESRDDAQQTWKALSSEHSSLATTRFSIAAEQIRQ